MQWRRIVFSFVIVFGAILWALPSSALAFDFCVASFSGDTNCGGAQYVPVCATPTGDCVAGVLNGLYEHCCRSALDPCTAGTPLAGTACPSGQAQINSCPGGTKYCVLTTSLTPPPGGSVTACGTSGGTCQLSCSGATPTVDTTGNSACSANAVNKTCCKATTCVPVPPATVCTTPPPVDCAANPTATGCVKTTVKNPLAFSTVEGVLGSILSTLQAIIVVLALISIVIGGILYITSAGNDERMKTAKGAITAAAIGLALGLAAPSFLKQIGAILGWGPVAPTVDCTAIIVPADLAKCQVAQAALLAGKPLSAIALSALQFLLSVVGVLGIIMLVIGGLTYLTSAGNEEQSESGKKIVTYAIIGIAVALASLIAVTQIAGLFVP